jgi:hypothetical protein
MSAHDQFLSAVAQQVDLKSIDWNKVAEKCSIPTAAAARVRFTRLKAKLENNATGAASNPGSPTKAASKVTNRKAKTVDNDGDGAEQETVKPKRGKKAASKVKVENTEGDDDEEDSSNAKPIIKKGTAKAKSKGGKKAITPVEIDEEDDILAEDCEGEQLTSPSKQLLESATHHTFADAV